MNHWYYSPYQYELRERLVDILTDPQRIGLGRRAGIPTPAIVATVGAMAFLAYTPLLQPGPPAKTPTPGTLPIFNVGRFVI